MRPTNATGSAFDIAVEQLAPLAAWLEQSEGFRLAAPLNDDELARAISAQGGEVVVLFRDGRVAPRGEQGVRAATRLLLVCREK